MREKEFEELKKKAKQVESSNESEEYKKGFTRISNHVVEANDEEEKED